MDREHGEEDHPEKRSGPMDRYEMLFENNPIVIWEHDFSQSKAYIDELAAETVEMEEYLRSNPEEVVELFDRVRTIGVNQNAVEYYRADSKEHLLENVDQVLSEEAWDLTIDLWTSVAEGKTRFRGETVARTFDGERRHQILDMYVPTVHAHDYARVYMTGTDIHELKLRERELERERDRLEEFASLVSHDLRNPLTVAQGRIELAREESESEHLESAANAIDRSLELIDDVLSLARAGKQVSESEPVELPTLVRSCMDNVETREATLDIDAHASIRANRSRLSQLLENLIRNAVEHGGEDLIITVGDLDDGFYLEDNGHGIPEEERERVFEAGYSLDPEGTGFGLSIVKEVAEAHGWEISLTESSQGGARFEITGVEFVG
jgi:signal transduction histidine kinase